MTKRYIARPKLDDGEEYWEDELTVLPETITVFEPEEAGPRDTGLVDQYGNTIYAVVERRPIGFLRE